jgi:hypothetical protein
MKFGLALALKGRGFSHAALFYAVILTLSEGEGEGPRICRCMFVLLGTQTVLAAPTNYP